MNQKIFVTAGLILVALGIGFASWILSAPEAPRMRHDREVTINGKSLQLEIAQTPAAIVQGLSGRKTMAADEGMLFIMPNVEYQTFWMKDMNFAIDIVFLREGRVVDKVTLQPPRRTKIPSHRSIAEADMVLELGEGMAAQYGLEVGTKTTLHELR